MRHQGGSRCHRLPEPDVQLAKTDKSSSSPGDQQKHDDEESGGLSKVPRMVSCTLAGIFADQPAERSSHESRVCLVGCGLALSGLRELFVGSVMPFTTFALWDGRSACLWTLSWLRLGTCSTPAFLIIVFLLIPQEELLLSTLALHVVLTAFNRFLSKRTRGRDHIPSHKLEEVSNGNASAEVSLCLASARFKLNNLQHP